MKRIIFAFVALTVVLALANFTLGQGFTKVGQAGGTFLKIEVGSRGVAMGGAQVASTRDASALFWNPAGIGFLEKNAVHFSHSKWIADLQHSFFAAAIPFANFGAVGVSVNTLAYGDMEETTIAQPEGTGNTFGANDLALGLTFARQFTDNFVTGVTVKYVRQSVWDLHASGLAFDFGMVFRTPFRGLSLGMLINNFGQNLRFTGQQLIRKQKEYNNITTTAQYETESFQLPLQFKLGIGYEANITEANKLVLVVDGIHPNDNLEQLSFGGEYSWNNWVFLRAGYKIRLQNITVIKRDEYNRPYTSEEYEPNTDIQRLTAGGGINLRLGQFETRLDYAFRQLEFFDNVHQFSVNFLF